MAYHLEDLFQSINDIYFQFDEGEVSAAEAENLAERCCHEFIRDRLNKTHHTLAVAFGRGILDGEQLTELLNIYRGIK
jgi:hypothetical protein